MKRHLLTLLLGAAGFGLAYVITLPNYHHAAGLMRTDCVECLSAAYSNTAQLLEQARRAQAAEVSSATR